DTDETFETEMTRRDSPFRAYLTIIEGCDKACAYCLVPHTRGPERSRASDAILREVRQLTELGYSEVQLLGQTVNSYADPTPRKMPFLGFFAGVARGAGTPGVTFHTLPPGGFHPRHCSGDRLATEDLQPRAPAGSVRVNPRAALDAAELHARGISGQDRYDSRG